MSRRIEDDIHKVMRKKRKGHDPNDRGYSHKLNKKLRQKAYKLKGKQHE
jgi:hypothetical protein